MHKSPSSGLYPEYIFRRVVFYEVGESEVKDHLSQQALNKREAKNELS
jgi:hypothetical protein